MAEIYNQDKKDWSKQIIEEASIDYLDKNAIALARLMYKDKEVIDDMSDTEFLTKVKLIINGKITNAAMVLLGNEDFDYLFSTPPEVCWRLFDSEGNIRDSEIFKIPYITINDRIIPKIHNQVYRYMPNQLSLFPTEAYQYDMWLLRELMNNCIVHSDYFIGSRIILDEFDDKLVLTNPGSFLPGSIETVLKPSYNPPFYRNPLLAEAMVKFNLINTQTMGIRQAFKIQQEKFLPLPDYALSAARQVSVVIYGKVLDEAYNSVLFDNPDFDLNTVFLIDRVQKRDKISKESVKYLRKLGVVEGSFPNIYLSAKVAESMGDKIQYVKNKGFDDVYYKNIIVEYIRKFGKGRKQDFVNLLGNKLPDVLDEKQKIYKIQNLLSALKHENLIDTDSENKRTASWVLKVSLKSR